MRSVIIRQVDFELSQSEFTRYCLADRLSSTHSEHIFELDCRSVSVDPVLLQREIILFVVLNDHYERQYDLDYSLIQSCLKLPHIKVGLGGPGTWRNGEVSSSYMNA